MPRQIIGLWGSLVKTCVNLEAITTPIVVCYLLNRAGSFDSASVYVAAHALLTEFSI